MKRAKNGAWSGSPSRRSRFTRCDTHRNHFLIYPRRPINMDVDDSEFLPDETDENPDRVWWPRLSQFRSVGVRDFLANFPTPSPHALGNGISDRLEICLAGLVESLRGWSVWPGTGPITTTTLESSTFYARRTRIVRRGSGGAELARRLDPFTAIRSADRERVTPTAVRY